MALAAPLAKLGQLEEAKAVGTRVLELQPTFGYGRQLRTSELYPRSRRILETHYAPPDCRNSPVAFDFRYWHLANPPANSTSVRFWHKADIEVAPSNVRFGG